MKNLATLKNIQQTIWQAEKEQYEQKKERDKFKTFHRNCEKAANLLLDATHAIYLEDD